MPAAEDIIDRYGLIGYPVAHSRSPLIHGLFARQTAQRMVYELFEVEPSELDRAVGEFQRKGGKGLNVTLPHKVAVMELADTLSDRASEAGAVNTLVFGKNEIVGDNTDGAGLVHDLTVNLGIEVRGNSILVLGAGGATRGIVGPLLDLQPAGIMIANRTVAKADAIAEHFGRRGPVQSCPLDAIPESQQWQLIINATSAGYTGDDLAYPASVIGANTVCYDLSYAAASTPFCTWAAQNGAARSIMGWGMLVEQAAESFYLWRGVRPDTAAVLRQLTVSA